LFLSSTLTISATSGSHFNVLLTSLSLANVAGSAINFNSASNYNWLIADFASVTGFAADAFNINTTDFQNPFTGTFGVALGNTGGIGGDSSQSVLGAERPSAASSFGPYPITNGSPGFGLSGRRVQRRFSA